MLETIRLYKNCFPLPYSIVKEQMGTNPLILIIKLIEELFGGDNRDRTGDLSLAKAALSQLSYIPKIYINMVGLSGFEPLTSRLSGARSNQLSYRPVKNRTGVRFSLKTK
jgi:hypothetical protein